MPGEIGVARPEAGARGAAVGAAHLDRLALGRVDLEPDAGVEHGALAEVEQAVADGIGRVRAAVAGPGAIVPPMSATGTA